MDDVSEKKVMIKEDKKGHTYLQWIYAMLATITMLSYGLQAGWMSPMTPLLKSNETPIGYQLTDSHLSMISSVMCLAAMMTAVLYSYVADRYGRKIAIIAIIVPQLLSWVLKLATRNVIGLVLARVLCGIASGGVFHLIPMYTKEIGQDDIRGKLGSLMFLFQNLGFLFIYALGAYMSYTTVTWIVFLVPVLNLLFMLRAPESPSFLIKIGRTDEAEAQLARLRGLSTEDVKVKAEMQTLIEEDSYYKSIPQVTYISMFKTRLNRKAIAIILGLVAFQACNGGFAILMYASSVMESAGVTVSPELQTLSIPAIMIIGSFVSMSCVEKFGRKILFISNLILAGATIGLLGVVILLLSNQIATPWWLPTVLIGICLFACAVGIFPMPYIVMSEMLNSQVRAKFMDVAVTVSWSITFIQLLSFGTVSAALGMHATFIGFAAINFLAVPFTIFFVPETKGKSIEEIENELLKK